jgi:hypothetical protein
MVLFGFSLLACTDTSTEPSSETLTGESYDYDDFLHLQVNRFEDQLYYLDGTYYIYYYSERCPGCNNIKQDVLSKIASLKTDTVLLFDVSYNYARGIDIEPSFNLEYTPSIVRVYDNEHVATYDNYGNAGLVLSIFDELE